MRVGGRPMDPAILIAFGVAAVVGLAASWSILRRLRRPGENPFAASTEGAVRCPHCGFGNMLTDRTCASCARPLSG